MFKLPLTKRYIPAVTLIAIFVIFGNIITNKLITSNNEYAKIINMSGKQRMLSQRLVILASSFNVEPNNVNKSAFKDALLEIETAHKFLLTKVFTKKLEDIYFKENLDKNLKKYLSHFYNLLETQDRKNVYNARNSSKDILVQFDKAVKEYEKYANDQLKELNNYEFYLMLGTLFVLFLEVVFIFIPASKKIDAHTAKLELQEEYEEAVIESNNTAIIAIDWTSKITTYNKKAEDIFGWTKDEMIGKRNLFKIIPKEYKKQHGNASQKYLETGKSCGVIDRVFELEGITKDGEVFPIQISFGSKWKPKGAIVVASIMDMSKQKEQDAFIIQQSKMASMGEMIGNIAHQWRQPLSAISSTASGIQVEKEFGILTDDELDERLKGIVDKTQYLSQTIDDFRNFFKQSNEKEKFIVNDVIKNVENIIYAAYNSSGIVLIKNYHNAVNTSCIGFANELSQVLINIINNAKDILVENKSIDKIVKICLEHDGDNVIIKIHDSAGGIPIDILPKVFDPYFTTKHQSQGTGIGLYMSSKIIHDHFDGKLSAKNGEFKVDEKEYFGACFEINIPTGIEENS